MTKPTVLILLVLSLSLWGCAATTARDQVRPAASISFEDRTRMESEIARKMRADKEPFNLLSTKMDEYQEMLAICEGVSKTDEGSALSATCVERLKALKQDLEVLSCLLQGQQ
jgi:hypothetical protein